MTDGGIATIQALLGSEIFFFVVLFILIVGIMFFIRASKEFIVGILFLGLTYVGMSGIIPLWISRIFLVIMGVFIPTILWKFFFKGGQ